MPSEEQLVPFLTTLVCRGPGSNPERTLYQLSYRGRSYPIQELDEIVNDHFGSGDAQKQSTNDEAELKEQPQADDVEEEDRDNPPDWEN